VKFNLESNIRDTGGSSSIEKIKAKYMNNNAEKNVYVSESFSSKVVNNIELIKAKYNKVGDGVIASHKVNIEDKLRKYKLEMNNDTLAKDVLIPNNKITPQIENGQSHLNNQKHNNEIENDFIIEKLAKLELALGKLTEEKVNDKTEPVIKEEIQSIRSKPIQVIREEKIPIPIPKQPKVPKQDIDEDFSDVIPIMEKVNRLREYKPECCEKK
jgi:hypothetical protein